MKFKQKSTGTTLVPASAEVAAQYAANAECYDPVDEEAKKLRASLNEKDEADGSGAE